MTSCLAKTRVSWRTQLLVSVTCCLGVGSPELCAAPNPDEIAAGIRDSFHLDGGIHLKWSVSTETRAELKGSINIASVGVYYAADEYAAKADKRYRHSTSVMPEEGRRESFHTLADGVIRWQDLNYPTPDSEPMMSSLDVLSDSPVERDNLEHLASYLEYVGNPFYNGEYTETRALRMLRKKQGVDVKDDDRPFQVIAACESGLYKVDASMVKLNGSDCCVLQHPGYDKLWLDVDKNFALVQREWQLYEGGPVSMRYRASRFRKVAQGLWLPQTVTRDLMVEPAVHKDVAPGTIHFTTTAKLTHAKTNVPDSIFVYKPAVGTYVMDDTHTVNGRAATIQYQIGGTEEATQAAISQGLRKFEIRQKANNAAARRRWAFIALNAGVVLCLVGVIWWKRRASR